MRVKNIIKPFLILLISTVLLSACSKEKKLNKSIIGTWKVTSMMEQPFDSDGDLFYTETEADFDSYTYKFFEDGNGEAIYSGGGSILETEITWDHKYNSNTKEETLTIDVYGDTRVYKINTHIKNSKLKLEYSETYEGGSRIEGDYEFSKQ